MKNSEIRKRLKLSSHHDFDNKLFRLNQKNIINQLCISEKNRKNQLNDNSINLIDRQQYLKEQQKNIKMNKTHNPNDRIVKKGKLKGNTFIVKNYVEMNMLPSARQAGIIIRYLQSSKQELKPKKVSTQIKNIQRKIKQFQETNCLKYSSESKTFYQSNNKTQHRHKNYAPISYGNLLIQSNLIQTSNLINYPQNIEETLQTSSGKVDSIRQNKQKQQWYLRALQKHCKQTQNNQKIKLIYSSSQQYQQSGRFNKKIISQKDYPVSRSLYPKLQSRFKKRSVSYDIKYI